MNKDFDNNIPDFARRRIGLKVILFLLVISLAILVVQLFFKETFSFGEEYSDVLRLKKMKIIREHFIEIDKQCFSENTWWSYILEQVEDGIL